jgi:PAS domain S-box-containing protein
MKKHQAQSAGAAALRRSAEERLAHAKPEIPEQRTEVETTRLVHELEVHQIELEMQNEELQQTRAKAEALLAQYTDLYDFAPVGYVTLTGDGTILAVNLTGARLLGVERANLIDRRFGLLVSEADRLAFSTFLGAAFAEESRKHCEVSLPRDENEPLFLRIEAVVSKDRQTCRAAVLDVTERHRAESERERLIHDLQTALARVKTLSGLLPICASCKKIRDDSGYWKQVESYIMSHSEATFSHSICPDCFNKLYPELAGSFPMDEHPGRPAKRTPNVSRDQGSSKSAVADPDG